MSIPTDESILKTLDRLDENIADELETQWLEFKPWEGPKDSLRTAIEYAVCFANANGGVIVFGVADRTRGRKEAIHGAARYKIDSWRRTIYDSTKPNISADVYELPVSEGTGKLLVVRIPRGGDYAYGTTQGVFKKRIGCNCMPMDPAAFMRGRISSGAVDWSGHWTESIGVAELDAVEIARARNMLRKINPDSSLLRCDDNAFLVGIGAIRQGKVTNTGLLLFGREDIISEICPQHQVHYVHQISDTKIARSDTYKVGLLGIVEKIEQVFLGPSNPEVEVTIGLFKLRIPSYPIEVVREAVLNAITHRDYSEPGEVLIRHTTSELVVTSPGGFIAGITPKNILSHEPVSRNRTLAEAFEKLRLVERAGMGRRRIFIPMLSYGKQIPKYETDGHRVVLRIYDGSFDERMAGLVKKWEKDGREIGLNALLVLSYLKQNAYIDSRGAAKLLQVDLDRARGILDSLAQPRDGILERKGRTKAATFHLTKGVAKDLIGRAAYTRTRGAVQQARYAEMVRQFVKDHGSITPKECRELLNLGESQSAKVEVSRLFKKWTKKEGFLRREGRPPKVKYFAH